MMIKKIRMALLIFIACMMLCGGIQSQAISITDLEQETNIDVSVTRKETWNTYTYLIDVVDGVYSTTIGDTAITLTVKSGTLPADVKLMIIAVSQEDQAYEWFTSLLAGNGTRHLPYDIFFYKDGQRVEFEGTLEISFTIPEGYDLPQVFYVSNDGSVMKLDAEISDGKIVITTTHNSYYVLNNGLGDAPNPPDTGDVSGSGLWFALLCSSLLTLSVFKLRKWNAR